MKSYSLKIKFSRPDGLIARLALVTERRGYAIEAIRVNKCTDDYSCMDLTIEGDPQKFGLVCKQIQKLIDVISVEIVNQAVTDPVESLIYN